MKRIKGIFKRKSKDGFDLDSSMRGSISSLYSSHSSELNRLDSTKIRLPKLHQAAKTGNVMKIDKELRKCPVDTVDAIGRTSIHIACLYNKKDAVKMLCRQPRANINAADSEGRTPLMYAAEYGNYDCVEALLEKSPDLSLCDAFGCNALHYALWTERPDQFIVRVLCQSGVPLHKRDKEGRTSLHLASKRNQAKLIPILIEYHAELDICDDQGNSPLMMAAAEGHYACVQLLAEAGARITVKSAEGHTAEHIAHINGHQGVYDYLKLSRESKSSNERATEEQSESESESSITAISNSRSQLQVPIPSCATFKTEKNKNNDEDEEDSVSWKSSSSSYLTSSGNEAESEKKKKEEPKKIDFTQVLNNFNGNFTREQNFSHQNSENENLAENNQMESKWDSDTEDDTDLTSEVKQSKPDKMDKVVIEGEDEDSKWSDSDSDSLVIKQSAKQVKKEESVEKLKDFYQKTGANEDIINHGLMGSPLPAAGAAEYNSEEEESKWDSDTKGSVTEAAVKAVQLTKDELSDWDTNQSESVIKPKEEEESKWDSETTHPRANKDLDGAQDTDSDVDSDLDAVGEKMREIVHAQSRPTSSAHLPLQSRPSSAPKPMIKPASAIATYDNRRGMGRSLMGEDEACSSFASIDLEHQRELEGKDEKIQFLEANLRRTQDQLERLNDERPANEIHLNRRIAEAETLAAEFKQTEEAATRELRNAMLQNNQLSSERDQLLVELDRRNGASSDVVDELRYTVDELRQNERQLKMANNDLELKIEEQSKVKAMIEGINQSNMKNIESFEEQIQQRNVTINSLRSENDELKSKVSKSSQDLKVTKEQSERYREEAEQLAETSVYEGQVDEYRQRNDMLEQAIRDKDDEIHNMTLRTHQELSQARNETDQMRHVLDTTQHSLHESRERLHSVEAELRQVAFNQPHLKTENEELKSAKVAAEERLRSVEVATSTSTLKIDQLQQENEKLRQECLHANVKIQEHLGSIRVAETSVEHFRKMFDSDREGAAKVRDQLDELRHEKNEVTRDRDDQLNQSRSVQQRHEQLESEKRGIELELTKAQAKTDQARLQAENDRRDLERQLSTARAEAEHNKERYENQADENGKLRDEVERVKSQEMTQARKLAQLEAQVNSDSAVRDSLSFREQTWQDERGELRDEITHLRHEVSAIKASKDDGDRRNRDLIEDLKLEKANLENRCRAKGDDLERAKELADKHHRATISAEEKGLATIEENVLLKKEVDRIKVESGTITVATNDQLSQLRLEVEGLKLKLRNEENTRRKTQKELRETVARLERARNKKRGAKLDGTEIEDIQARYHQEARKELEGKLAQVSEFLAQQSLQTEKLEQMRAENSMHEKQLSARRIADLEARLGANQVLVETGDQQSGESRYRKLYRDECRARERAESQMRRQEQTAQDLQHRVDRERATRLQYQPMGYATYGASSLYSPIKTLPQSLHHSTNQNPQLTSTRRNSGTMANGVYSRMNDVVTRAAAEPISRASPLQRI